MELPELSFGDKRCRLPIVQGGMGVGISLSGLAGAVAREGGVGVVAAAMIGIGEPDVSTKCAEANGRAMAREIKKARETADGNGLVGANIMVALTHFADLVHGALREKADVIFAGAGLPLDLPKYLKEFADETGEVAATKLVPIVSSARAAKVLCKKWLSRFNYLPDGFVVEGPMAGGHVGFKPEEVEDPKFQLENLLPDVIKVAREFSEKHGKHIPVIAAGGIFSGEDICKYMKMGADGVQMGTRFVATHECDADIAFKQAYVDATEADMTVIKSPVGLPGNALRNNFLDQVAEGKKHPFKCPFKCLHTCEIERSPYCIALALVSAKRGKLKHGFAFAGRNAWRTEKIVSVRELLQSLANEFKIACSPA